MRSKLLNLLLIITSLAGYLEWGGGNSAFLFEAEAEVLSKIFTDAASVVHPFTLLPMVGQLLLLITLFQKKPGRLLTWTGLFGIGILLVFMFVIGIMSLNIKVALSTIPFLAVAVLTIRHYRRAQR
ncbi:MAG: hypothetical protein JNK10_11400 [Cyclobacteriaceae bacterium]|nr:hypothetical protein [Cyclobacteriaceae bacterium]